MLPESPRFRFAIQTLGCKANLTDSQNLGDRLQALGGIHVEPQSAESDVYIVNSCTVTDRADRDALALVRKHKAKLKVFTGCLAEVDPQAIGAENILVARNSAKQDLASAIVERLFRESSTLAPNANVLTGDRLAWHRDFDHVSGASLRGAVRTRALLKVQDGCNQFCAYCIIPQARGRSRSLDLESIVREVQLLEAAGVQEVVLTAIHAADYEWNGIDYTGLVKIVLHRTKIPRIRLTSLDPAEIPERLLDLLVEEPRLCPHFHVSLQSAASRVLAAMDRHYTGEEAEACLENIAARIPHAFVGMDMIAGFPGETEADHAETLARLERSPWTKLHVFPYSVRRNTKAAKLVAEGFGVAEAVKRRRAQELRELSQMRYHSALEERCGKIMEILVEEKVAFYDGQPYASGHSRSYFPVLIPGTVTANERRRVLVEKVDFTREVLLGNLV